MNVSSSAAYALLLADPDLEVGARQVGLADLRLSLLLLALGYARVQFGKLGGVRGLHRGEQARVHFQAQLLAHDRVQRRHLALLDQREQLLGGSGCRDPLLCGGEAQVGHRNVLIFGRLRLGGRRAARHPCNPPQR